MPYTLKGLICLCFFSTISLIQAQPTVIANDGKTLNDDNNRVRLSFTIGETLIATLNATGISYGQGFHNGALPLTTQTEDLDLAIWQLQIHPNPVSDMLYLSFIKPNTDDYLTVSVWNIEGQQLIALVKINDFNKLQIPVSQLVAGMYLLRIRDSIGRTASVRFVKSH